MRRWVILAAALWMGVAAAACPGEAWFGRASAMVLLPSAATRADLASGPEGPAARLTRIVFPRLEVSASVSSGDPFDLEAKLVLVNDLAPLFAAATVAVDWIGVVSTLFFGPVQIDWGRVWGAGACRWATLQLSARPRLSLVLGINAAAGVEPFAAVRIFPAGGAAWEIGLSAARHALRLSLGGAFP